MGNYYLHSDWLESSVFQNVLRIISESIARHVKKCYISWPSLGVIKFPQNYGASVLMYKIREIYYLQIFNLI